MHIEGIELINWLAHRRLDRDFRPFTVIGGPNHSGKTSIGDSLAFGLLSELCRVEEKGDRVQLISEGAEKGQVTLHVAGHGEATRTITRDIATGKLATRDAIPVGGAVTEAMPYVLATWRFCRASPDARRALLFKVERVKMDPATIFNELAKRKHPMSLLDRLEKELPGGTPEAWSSFAAKRATEARGGWKAVTGETYGDKKAATWSRDPGEAPTTEDLVAAREAAQEGQRAADRAGEALGRSQTAARLRNTVDRQVESLEAEVATAKAARPLLKAQRAALPGLEADAAAAKAALAELDARASGEDTSSCPHCGGLVHVSRTGTLTEAGASPPKPSAAEMARAREASRAADAAVLACRNKISGAERDIEAGARAQNGLDGIERADQEDPSLPIEEAQAAATKAREAAQAASARVTELERLRMAADRAASDTAQAAQLHADVQAWAALSADLEPSGLPGELLAKALTPINNLLRDFAAETGWRQVAIGADMSITAGGRRYGLLSESEQWRVETMLGAALAARSGLGMVLLDRFDVLEVQARRPTLGWLYGLTKKGVLEQVILAGTMKEALQVPADAALIWLGADEAERAAA